MLGNVEQMMLESFRLNRVGRLHGQAGGLIVRGGSYTSSPASLHTAMRGELPPFDPRTNAPNRLSTVGFRLVLSAPTVGNLVETEQANQNFKTVLAGQDNAPDDPAQLIATLRDALTSEPLRHDLDLISAKLASADRNRADEERTAMLAQLEAASVMANFVWTLEAQARTVEKMIDGVFAGHADQQESARATVARRRNQVRASLDGYLRLLRGVSLGPAGRDIEAQSALLRQEMVSRGQQQLFGLLAVATKHAIMQRDGKLLSRDSALADIIATPSSDTSR
jgi:hypothetical protein